MKYLKRYERFVSESSKMVAKNIDRELKLVESQVLRDFSGSFWEMSLRSSAFTEEEKGFIRESLMSFEIDLVREGWLVDTLKAGWEKAKEAGGKVWDKVKSKVEIIRNNIKDLCA